MQTRILNRQDMARETRLVVVGMPEAGGRDKHGMRLPIKPFPVLDLAVGPQSFPNQRVAAGLGVDDEIHRHRLMPMRSLNGADR